MNENDRPAVPFSAEMFAAMREVAPYRSRLHSRLVFDIDLDHTGNDVWGGVEQVRIEAGRLPLAGTAVFRRRSRFETVERITLHGTAADIGEQLGHYVIQHGATPAPATT